MSEVAHTSKVAHVGEVARLSERLRIAFQGEAGAFSEEAVHQCFGAENVAAVPCRDFDAVAAAILDDAVDAGMLPVENSIAGGVAAAYDVLAGARLTIHGELVRPIRLCLLGLPGSQTASLERVLSHPVALAQCTRFLNTLGAERIAVYDTAGAAREVLRRGDATQGAVAGLGAASHYGLEVLAEDIQDRNDNQTRFLVIGRNGGIAPPVQLRAGSYKTALLLETEHRAGALVEILQPFSEAGISLTHIESRPGERPWHYRFVLELLADAASEPGRTAIETVRRRARSLVVLGSFRHLGSAE